MELLSYWSLEWIANNNWQSLGKPEYCGLIWVQANLLRLRFFRLPCLFLLTIPRILRSKPHPDETDIFSSWQRGNASGVGPEPSVQPQREVARGLWYSSDGSIYRASWPGSYWRSPEKNIRRCMVWYSSWPLRVQRVVSKLLLSQIFFPWCVDRSNKMKHNVRYGPGDPKIHQSWTMIIRTKGFCLFLGKNKIEFLTCDLESRINRLVRLIST